MKRLTPLFKRLFRRRSLTVPAALQTITEERLAEMFLAAPNHPAWQATLVQLDLQVQEDLDQTIDENLTNEQMRYRLGGVAALLQFKQVLIDRERAARLTQAQAEVEKRDTGEPEA